MKAFNGSLTNPEGRLFRRSKSVLVTSELRSSGAGNADNTAYELLSSSSVRVTTSSSAKHDYSRRGNIVWVIFRKVFAFRRRSGDEAISNRRRPGVDDAKSSRRKATEKEDHGSTRIKNQSIWIAGPYSRWPVHGRRPVRRCNSLS